VGWLLSGAPLASAETGEAVLLRLGDRAYGEADYTTAGGRYQRVFDVNPKSAPALAGLGDVAARRGDNAEAESRYRVALEIDPGLSRAQLGLADLLHQSGDATAARAHLDAALATSPLDPRLHQRGWVWTGLAKGMAPTDTGLDTSPAAVRERARAHPYDSRVQIAQAKLAIAEGDEAGARAALETALLMADVIPRTAVEAARLLADLDGGAIRFVPVYVYADESVQAKPSWKFELRIAFGRASAVLRPLLDTIFVPVSIKTFTTAGVLDDLGAVHNAMLSAIPRQPLSGIIAGFTRRKSPRTRTAHRLGEARYFGRELVVRLNEKDLEGRTLAHEVLHLYGAMHLAPEIPSLMNPVSGDWVLDAYTVRILKLTASRRFGPGSFERNILSHVDNEALADALVAALRVNVHFRNVDVAGAHAEAERSKGVARFEMRQATTEDQVLAQVAELTAWVLMRADRPAQAVRMMENAGKLYGVRKKRGRAAMAQAEAWRAAYRSILVK